MENPLMKESIIHLACNVKTIKWEWRTTSWYQTRSKQHQQTNVNEFWREVTKPNLISGQVAVWSLSYLNKHLPASYVYRWSNEVNPCGYTSFWKVKRCFKPTPCKHSLRRSYSSVHRWETKAYMIIILYTVNISEYHSAVTLDSEAHNLSYFKSNKNVKIFK